MFLRTLIIVSAAFVVGAAGLFFASNMVDAASYEPHGGGGSGIPYYGGQIQSVNDTYYVNELATAMNNWQWTTGRRYVDQWASGETMGQFVVYAGTAQDTSVANTYGSHSCAWWHDNGYSGWRSFELGIGPALNRDSSVTVICLFVTAMGYSPGYDQVDPTTRNRGMIHEMGHSLHLGHDTDGAMCTCWSYDINQAEVDYVNYIYAVAP